MLLSKLLSANITWINNGNFFVFCHLNSLCSHMNSFVDVDTVAVTRGIIATWFITSKDGKLISNYINQVK